MIKHIVITFLVFSIGVAAVSAQHRPVYSTYIFNGLVINPAYCGQSNALSIALAARSQWAGNHGSGAPQTYSLTAHTPLRNNHFAAGGILSYDKLGITSTTELIATFAYRYKIQNTVVSLGAQVGNAFVSNDFSEISTIQQNDPAFSKNLTANVIKGGIGIHINNKKFFAGASIPAIPISNKYQWLYEQQFYYAGYNFQLNDYLILKPSVLLKNIKSSGLQVDINLFCNIYQKFNAGISYRWDDALVLLGIVNLSKQLSIGYSYDYTISPLRNYNRSSHEILLRYDFRYFVKDVNFKTFK